MNISKSLELAMKKSGVTRKELCERSGVTNPYLTWVLQGKMNPKVTTVERLANAMGMTTIEFLQLGE